MVRYRAVTCCSGIASDSATRRVGSSLRRNRQLRTSTGRKIGSDLEQGNPGEDGYRNVSAPCREFSEREPFPSKMVPSQLPSCPLSTRCRGSSATARRALILPIFIDVLRPRWFVQSVPVQTSLEVDEGVPGMTGSRLVVCGSLIVDDFTSL